MDFAVHFKMENTSPVNVFVLNHFVLLLETQGKGPILGIPTYQVHLFVCQKDETIDENARKDFNQSI